MIYTQDIIGYQWDVFVSAIMLGILLGGCYDVVRIIRTIFCFGKKAYIASDFVFCVWAAFLIFSFLLNKNYGMPRLYIYIGITAGFCLWYFTMGRISIAFAKILKKVFCAVFKPLKKILHKTGENINKRLSFIKIFLLKTETKYKSLLKTGSKVVYNILCLNMLKAFSFWGEKAGKEPEKVESSGTEKTEERTFSSDCSYCIRGVSSLLADIDAGEHQHKKK